MAGTEEDGSEMVYDCGDVTRHDLGGVGVRRGSHRPNA